MNRLDLIKEAALKAKAKKLGVDVEELKFQETIKKLDARKAKIKADQKKIKKDLTSQIKKAGHLKSGALDLNRPENMYYTEKETQDWFESSSLFDNYANTHKEWD